MVEKGTGKGGSRLQVMLRLFTPLNQEAGDVTRQLTQKRTNSTAEAKAIGQICVRCVEVSNILLRQLGKLHFQEEGLGICGCPMRRRKWKSFRMALKSVCSKDEINDMALWLFESFTTDFTTLILNLLT